MILEQCMATSTVPSPPSTLSSSSQPARAPPGSGRISRRQRPDQLGGRQNLSENGKFKGLNFPNSMLLKIFL